MIVMVFMVRLGATGRNFRVGTRRYKLEYKLPGEWRRICPLVVRPSEGEKGFGSAAR